MIRIRSSASAKGLVLLAAAVVLSGCAPKRPLVRTETRRAGRVFLIRGLINIYSLGMDTLARKLREKEVDARPCQWMSYTDLTKYLIKSYKEGDREPICFVGHSQGVDDAIRVSRELKKHDIPVALLVGLEEWYVHEIPSNVRRVVTIHKRDSTLYFEDMGREEGRDARWRDVDLRKNPFDKMPGYVYHLYIDIDSKVHDIVMDEVLRICRRRPSVARRSEKAETPP